jgi:hypothetical protein
MRRAVVLLLTIATLSTATSGEDTVRVLRDLA